MATDVLTDEKTGFYANRFWGGTDRGSMVQLTIAPMSKPDGDLANIDQFGAYVSMSRQRFRAMVRLLAMKERRGEL